MKVQVGILVGRLLTAITAHANFANPADYRNPD